MLLHFLSKKGRLYSRGIRLEKQKKWGEAFSAFQQAIESTSSASGLLYAKLGKAAEKLGDWPTAAAAYSAALQKADMRPSWYLRLAYANEKLKDWDAAANAYESALTLGNAVPETFFQLASSRGKLKQWRNSFFAYRSAIDAKGEWADPAWYFYLGTAASNAGDWPSAIDAFHTFLSRHPEDQAGREQLANALLQAGQISEAFEEFQRLTSLAPQNPLAHIQSGRLLENTGHLDKAKASYIQALSSAAGSLTFDKAGLEQTQALPSTSIAVLKYAHGQFRATRVRRAKLPSGDDPTVLIRVENIACRIGPALDIINTQRQEVSDSWQRCYLDYLERCLAYNRDWLNRYYPNTSVVSTESAIVGTWMIRSENQRLVLRATSVIPLGTIYLFVNDKIVHAANARRLDSSLGEKVEYFQFPLRSSVLRALPKLARLSIGSNRGLLCTHDGGLDVLLETTEGTHDLFDRLENNHRMTKHGHLQLSVSQSVGWQKEILGAYQRFAMYFKDRFGYDLFVTYGLLLGIIRQNDFISNDDDIDVAFFSLKTSVEEVKEEMVKIINTLAADGWSVSVNPSRRMFKVLVDEFELDCFAGWVENGRIWMHNTTCFSGDASIFRPLRQVSFKGVDLLIPGQPEQFLTGVYGPKWHTPDPGYQAPVPAPEIRAHLKKGHLSRAEWAKLVADGTLNDD